MEGALILTVAVLVVKIIGAIYRIPLIAIIEVDGNGFYTTAYNIYSTIYSIAVSGFPVAISKIVAEFLSQGRYRDVRRVKSVSTLFFLVVGIIGSLTLALLAKPYVSFVNNSRALWCVVAVAPSILFSCLMSTHRGYNQGMSNMTPTALSQVVEVIFKMASGLVLSYFIKAYAMNEYEALGTVFGESFANDTEAHIVILSYSAAGAIFGVTVSVLAGYVFLAIRGRIKGDGITSQQLVDSPEPYSDRIILRRILSIGIPIALSSVSVSLTGLIDGASVLNRLAHALNTDSAALYASHGGLLEQAGRLFTGSNQEEIANYLYGAYGLGITLFNLIPTLTGSFGMSSLPHITSSWQQQDLSATKKNIESVLRLTMFFAAPAGFGISALAGPISRMLFAGKNPVGTEIQIPMLAILGVAAIFVAIVGPVSSMLQAVGRIDVPVKLMIFGGIVKIVANYILIGIPSLNIKAAPAGNLLCYLMISVLSIAMLSRTTGINFDIFGTMVKPLIAGIGCGGFAVIIYNVFHRYLGNSVSVFASVAAAAVVYVILCGILKTVSREDVEGLPSGTKIAAILEKLRIIR